MSAIYGLLLLADFGTFLLPFPHIYLLQNGQDVEFYAPSSSKSVSYHFWNKRI